MKRSFIACLVLLLGCSAEDAAPNEAITDAGSNAEASTDSGVPDAPAASTNDIDGFCANLSALPCGKTREQCVDDATALADEAAQKGCAAEFEALLACGAQGSMQCSAGGVALPECSEELAAMDACDPPSGTCFAADVPGVSCSKSCPSWGAACSETPQGLECSCTAGPSAGKTFTLPGTCEPSWASAGQAECE